MINYDLTDCGRFYEPRNTNVLTAHILQSLADKVDQMAARLERSRGWIMKQALAAWIDQEEERRRLTLEALADVDAGRVIDPCVGPARGRHVDQGAHTGAPLQIP
ncbi:MAG: ribbon-helix-helix protein, CopG family [Gammaproteobacteria bacterium]|nr:ribbon-helix-helix protein, CopG family [Gammaproteobacteria bacterium]